MGPDIRRAPVKDPPHNVTGGRQSAPPVSGYQGSIEGRYRRSAPSSGDATNRDPAYSRAHAARKQQMAKYRPRAKVERGTSRPQTIQPIQPSVVQQVVSEQAVKPAKTKWFTKQRMSYAMSIMVFVFGMASAGYGYIETQKAREQIAQLTGADGGSVQGATSSPGQPNALGLPDETPVTDYDISSYTAPADDPRYLKIDELGVNARVLNVGETPEGAVDTPGGIYDAGWYNKSARPGDASGAMLAVAHYSGLTDLGIFGRLNTLQNDDVVQIEQGDGTIHSFKVVEMTEYDYQSVDMKKALEPADPSELGLNLITCGGSFNAEANTYSERLLVRTVRI